MESVKEIIDKLNINEKIPFRKNTVNTNSELFININTKNFLTEYGLPQLENIFIVEDLRFFDYEDFAVYKNDKSKIIIGKDSGGFICADRYSGCLWSADPSGETPDYFVNSCISDFMMCLYYYKIYYINIASEISESDEIKVYKKLTGKFSEIDNAILDNDENWWSQIIEPLSYCEL